MKPRFPHNILIQFAVIMVTVGFIHNGSHAAKPFGRDVLLTTPSTRNYTITGNRRIDTDAGVLLAQYNMHIPVDHPDPEIAAMNYLMKRAADFGGLETVREMETIAIKRSPGGTHIHLQQTVEGITVYHGYFNVSINNNERICMVVANPIPHVLLPATSPVISKQTAISMTRSLLGGRGPELNEPHGELTAYRDRDGSDHLAWSIRLVSMDPMGDWEVLWDALDGSHLETADHMKYEDGTGMVFDPDPLTTAEVEYGQNYVDGDDSDIAELNSERIEVTLNDLTYEDGIYYLTGPYVEISDFELPEVDPVTSDDPDGFNFTRSQSGFEDVNVYYHIDYAQRHLQYLGFDDIQNAPIEADPHGLNGADNSHYSPDLNAMAFGEGGVDDAEDADIIYHEYGHAIQADQIPNFEGGHTGAMSEGFCDYWAGTFSARISDYNDTWFANWDGHNMFWNGRILDYFGVYPDHWQDDIYHDGQIWSSCLWNIRGDIGADEADAVIIQAHYYLEFGATVEDGAEALLLADEALFDGEHHQAIATNCYEKGFLDEIPGYSAIDGLVFNLDTEEPVEGAEVLLNDEAAGETDEDGRFFIGNLQPEEYTLTVTAEGYGPWSDEIELGLSDTVEVAIRLAQPLPHVNPDSLELIIPIESILDTALLLSNEGISELHWSLRFHPAGMEAPEPWTLETELDIVEITGDEHPYGCTVIDGYLVISGRNGLENPAQFYLLNMEGDLLDQVDQPTRNTYGYPDLTTDGDLIYGSEGSWIVGVDLNGNVQDSIPSPYYQNRALTYDPDNDWFWCSRYAGEITAVDRDGDIQAELNPDLDVWGLACNSYDPDGMPLYVSGIIELPEGDFIGVGKMNPETEETSIVLEIAEYNHVNPLTMLGLHISSSIEGLEQYSVCQVMINDAENQTVRLQLYLLDTALPWADATPKSGFLLEDETQRITLSFDASSLEIDEYLFDIDLVHNGFDSPLTVPVTLTVYAVGSRENTTAPDVFSLEPAYPNPFNASTSWSIHLPITSDIDLRVYNLLGQEVDHIRFERMSPDIKRIEWTAPFGLSSGVYFVQVEGNQDGFKALDKILLLK